MEGDSSSGRGIRELLQSDLYSGLETDQEVLMKPVLLSQDVLPLGEFKTQASRVLRKLKENQRPVIITQNGRAAAVLITPEEFDQMRERERFMTAVREGLADVEAGRLLDSEEVRRQLDAEFGPLES
jgi:prevent-host-death family protein